MSKKQVIENEIISAFDGVKLAGGISIEQTKVMDDWGDVRSAEFASLPLNEITEDWRAIPELVLDNADCTAYLDPTGYRYYIPALMLRLLDAYNSNSQMVIGTLSSLYPKTENDKSKYSELNEKQLRAIAHFLDVLPLLVELDTHDATVVDRAIRNYWNRYL